MWEDFARRFWALLLDTSLRSLILLAVACLTLLCLRRSSASVRHLVLLLTLVCLLCLPLVSASLPGWKVAVWPHKAALLPPLVLPPDAAPMPSDPGKTVAPVPPATPPAAVATPAPDSPDVSPFVVPVPPKSILPLIGVGLWVTGVCAVFAPVLLGLVGIRRLARRSFPLTAASVVGLAADLASQLGLNRPVALRQSVADDSPIVPMTWGWRRPVILLPSGAEDWPIERLRVVLLHELAHIQRRDWLWQMLSHGVCALYWYHPGVWLVARLLRLESERACDDQVLSAGIPAPEYAKHLVDVARSLSQTKGMSSVALPMAHTSQVESRVTAILQTGKIRTLMTRKNFVIAILLAVGVLAPLAILRPVAQAQSAVAKPSLPAKTDPAAVRLLRQMTEAYKALYSYSGTEVAEGSGAMGMPYRLSLAYTRPAKMALTHSRSFGQGQGFTHHIFLDGKTLVETSSDNTLGRYVRITKPETNYTLWEEALIDRCDVKFPIIMRLLEDKDIAFDKHPKTIISLGTPSRLDGMAVDTVVLTYPNLKGNASAVMQIGHNDHLLRRITETTGPEPDQEPMTTTQTFSNVHANPALPASTFVYTPPDGAVAVDVSPGGSHADPAAVALLTRMYAASAALKSFSCTLDSEATGVNVRTGNTYRAPELHETIALEKPGRVAMMRKDSQGEARAVADGTNLYVTTTESNGGLQALPARFLKLNIGPDDPNRLLWLSRFGNLPEYTQNQDFIPNVVLGWQTMPADSYDWKMGKPGVVNGEPVDTVTLRRDDGTSDRYDLLTLAISRRDHLLRQISMSYKDAHVPLFRRIETYTHIQINPTLPKSLFVFTPPPGSVSVATTGELFSVRKEKP